MYLVYASQGQGGVEVCICNSLEEAIEYVEEHEGEASFGIKQPDGTWYNWQNREYR